MNHKKKVLITGSTGFLGRYLVDILKDEYEIIGASRSLKDLSYEIRKTDYSLESLVDISKDVDMVVHLAAKRSGSSRIEDFHSNEVISQNLFEACMKNSIKNIVYASSISVYSDESLLAWKEDQYPSPINMYGVSKVAIENMANLYNKKYGMKIKSLRFAHLFGSFENNSYMINIFMRKAFKKEKLTVNNSPAKREFLYAKDCALAIKKALESDKEGIFNIGSDQALSNLEVAECINSVFMNEGNIEILEGNNDIQSSFMVNEKAKRDLAFNRKYSFKEAMEEIYEEMKKRGEKDNEKTA